MAIDRKYGKVTTEFGDIGEDEPVVVFRGADVVLPDILTYYAMQCIKRGSPIRHIVIIYNTMKNIIKWQNHNTDKIKILSSESSKERLPE